MLPGYIEETQYAIACVVDTGASIPIIPLKLANRLKVQIQISETINVRQAKGIIQLNQKCVLTIQIGQITKTLNFYVVETDLDYIILGLTECGIFNLIINCANRIVTQNNYVIKQVSSNRLHECLSLHFGEVEKVKAKKKKKKVQK